MPKEMKSLAWPVLSFAVLAVTNTTLAAETTSSAATDKILKDLFDRSREPPERISGDTVLITPGSTYYSTALAETGAQGTVLLLLDVSKDGQVTGAHVHTSSRSAELDSAAIRKALTMSYQGRGAPPSTVSLKVAFRRDEPFTLSAKTCEEFNVDVAWFRKAFPGRPETDMPAIQGLGNRVRVNYVSADRWLREPIFNAVPYAQCAIVPGCAAKPTETVGNIFNRAINKHERNPGSNKALCAFTPSEREDEGLPRSLLQVDLDQPIRLVAPEVTPEMSAYPPELVRSGIQGEVTLEVTLTNQGQTRDVKVLRNQSAVAALGNAAAAYARGLPLEREARADAPDTIVLLSVVFRKDTVDSIGNKTCGDFNIDLAAYQAAHPQADLRRMNAIIVARLLLHYSGEYDPPFKDWWQETMSPSQEPEPDHELLIAEQCAQQPEAKFMDVVRRQLLSKKE